MTTKQKQIEELEQQAKDALVKQQELLAQVQALKAMPALPMIDKHGRYLSELEIGTGYFWPSTAGIIYSDRWSDTSTDKKRLLQGNCFVTKEQAGTESTRQKLIQRARLFMAVDRLANDFEPDFVDDNIYPSHYLVLNEGRIYQGSNSLIAYFLTFSSHESRAQFRKEFTDDEIIMILDRG